jgi:hypothetical protein
VGLSFRQARQLRGIERRLRESEPDMAEMFADFAGISSGEAAIGAGRRPSPDRRRRWALGFGRIACDSLAILPLPASADWPDQGRAEGP